MIYLYISVIFFNFLIFYNLNKISRIYNIYDVPDNLRKRHKNSTPLLGGVIIYLNFCIIIALDYFNLFENNFINSNQELLVFYISASLCFLLGFFDDKYNLGANLKLLIIFFIVFFLQIFDHYLIIKDIALTFYWQKILLNSFSIPFTALCFLLFINAFNMIDGINAQAALYALVIFFIFIFLNINTKFFIFFLISLSFFLWFNFKNKIFLGDSGTLLLSFIISYVFIRSYNSGLIFSSDEIFLIMMIPGFELLRLAIFRIASKKHPFKADRNHIHHLIIDKKGYIFTLIIIQLLFFSPYLLNLIIKNTPLVVILFLLIYSSILYLFLKLKKND